MAKDSGSDTGRDGRDTFDGGKRGAGLPGFGAYAGYTQRGAIRRDSVIGGGNGVIGDGSVGARDVVSRSDVSSAYSGYSKTDSGKGASSLGGVPPGVAYTPDFSASLASKMRSSNQKRQVIAGIGNAAKQVVGDTSPDAFSPQKTAADFIADRLADVLERENTLYRDAAAISEKKTEVIVHGKIEELDALVKAEQAIILTIGKLEDERETIIGELSSELEYDLSSATLSDISALLCADSFERLGNCQKVLASTLGSLKNTNETNAQLIQNALDYINFSVNLMTSDQGAGNVYSPEGDDGGVSSRRNLFDVKL